MNLSSDTATGTDRPCGLTALLPLGMSCRGRAEAFARRLQSRLRTLGSNGPDDTNHVNNESTENTWLTSPDTASASSVTNHQPLATLSHEVADSYFDFDLPGRPTDDCECTQLLEKTVPATQDAPPESGYVCASPLSSLDNSEAANVSCSSSDEPYFDVEYSDMEPQSLQSNEFYDCDDSSRKEAAAEADTSSARSTSKANRLRVGQNIFHSLDSDSCSESLPKSQSTSGSTCTAPSSASNQTLHDDTDETDFCSLRDDIGHSATNGDCTVEPKQNGHTDEHAADAVENDEDTESLLEYEELESKLNAFKPFYRKISRQEIKDDSEINDDAKLINNVTVHESTPEKADPDDNNDVQPTHAKQNGYLSPIEDEEEISRPQRIRRCSSLKTGKTPPGTPGRKKIVRFADMMGLDLADVRTFLDEVPRVPRCAYEDLEVSMSHIAQISLGPRAEKMLMPMFQQPSAMPNFLDLVQQQNVALENAAVTDPICLTITGSVRVRNLDFHKSVHLRYSSNGWRSFADMQATYLENSCDGFSDKFTFMIFGNSLQVGERIEIAVRFSCKGQQFWDNNFGANYCFQCLPTTAPTQQRAGQNGNPNPLALSPIDAWCGSSFY